MDTKQIAQHPQREALASQEAIAARTVARTKRKRGFFGFARREDGAFALEFALILPVFLFMIFILFETAMTYWAERLLQMYATDLARQMRTGFTAQVADVDSNGDPITRAEDLCEDRSVTVLFDCSAMMIEVGEARTMGEPPRNSDQTVNGGGFMVNPGPPQSVNVVRVYYNWQRIFGIPVTPAGIPRPDNQLELYAAAGFVVE